MQIKKFAKKLVRNTSKFYYKYYITLLNKSSDIITEFRGRGDEIRIYPLSFSEFSSAFDGSIDDAWEQYIVYGGLPRILSFRNEIEKSSYLKQLFEKTYLSDIVERNNIQRVDVLGSVINILASSIGSLTNPNKLANTFESNGIKDVSINTITAYIKYLQDSFLIEKAEKYDVLYRGYNVDVGVVEIREGDNKNQVEVDFVYKRYYVQSLLSLLTRKETLQEERPLMNIPDNFKKIIVVKDDKKSWITEEGILVIGLKEFLLNQNSLDL